MPVKSLIAGLAVLALAAPLLGLAATAARAAPAVVGAHPPINLTPASQVTLRPAAGGYVVIDVRPAMGAPEIAPASRTATGETMVDIPRRLRFTTPPGTVRFTLWASQQSGARLKLENNSGRPIIYSAQLVVRGQRRGVPTTICSVQQGQAGYETWPDDVVAVIITGFYPASAGAQVCGNPERGALGAPPPTVAPAGGK